MFRNRITPAVVLHTHRIGEYHKGVTLLTPEMGIVSAIAHGAKKIRSKLRSATESFCFSTVYLYHDPVKDVYKITDMMVRNHHEGLRTSLVRFYTASLWIEILLKSFAGGQSSPEVFDLLVESLLWLVNTGEERSPYISFQFLWRFLSLAGYSPALDVCSRCESKLEEDERIYLSAQESVFYCRRCRQNGRPPAHQLTAGARRYLQGTSKKPLGQVIRVSLDRESADGLKSILHAYLQNVLEVPLNSLVSGRGMICESLPGCRCRPS